MKELLYEARQRLHPGYPSEIRVAEQPELTDIQGFSRGANQLRVEVTDQTGQGTNAQSKTQRRQPY